MYSPQDLRSEFLVRKEVESKDPNPRTEETDDSRELQERSGTSNDLSDNAVNDLTRLFISYYVIC